MARTFSLPSLRLQVRQRADMQSIAAQGFVTETELNTYINQSYTELYDLLIVACGQEYFLSEAAIIVGGNVDTYDLPNDFYRLLGVDATINATQSITLQPFNFIERNLFKSAYAGGWGLGYNLRYRIHGGLRIQFIPVPFTNTNITLFYIPAAPVIGETDLVDGVDGFEELMVVDAAIKCLQKEESDVTILMARKAELIARIQGMAPDRDASAPERVRDVNIPLLTSWPWA